jgi:hypothetical protein
MAGIVDAYRLILGWLSSPHVRRYRICADLVVRSRGTADLVPHNRGLAEIVATRTQATIAVPECGGE